MWLREREREKKTPIKDKQRRRPNNTEMKGTSVVMAGADILVKRNKIHTNICKNEEEEEREGVFMTALE